jgi:hypothetical protein
MQFAESQPTFRRNKSPPSACHLLSRCFLPWLIFTSRKSRRHAPPKHRLTFNGLYVATSQTIEILGLFLGSYSDSQSSMLFPNSSRKIPVLYFTFYYNLLHPHSFHFIIHLSSLSILYNSSY